MDNGNGMLAAVVKSIQKQDGGKDLWAAYVTTNGGGMKDPMHKSPEFLQSFIKDAQSTGYDITTALINAASGGGGVGGGDGGAAAWPTNDPWSGAGKGSKDGKGWSWGDDAWGAGNAWGGGGKGAWGKSKGGDTSQLMSAFSNMVQQFKGGVVLPSMASSQLDSFGQLVARVKAVQKFHGGADKWRAFIDQMGQGKRDPALRTADELQAFLAETDPTGATIGARAAQGAEEKRALSRSYPAQSPEHAHAIARVKAIQRVPGGKETWGAFVERIQSTKRDPAAHDVEVLESFLLEADPSNETFEVESHFDERERLVHEVRSGQKYSEEFKQAWIQHCQALGGDVRDPLRHTKEFLQSFLFTAPAVDPHNNDPYHKDLVQQVKDGQRESDDFKQKWWAHCAACGGGKNDPMKHSSDFLQSFMMMVQESATAPKPTLVSPKPTLVLQPPIPSFAPTAYAGAAARYSPY
jgi:hypothetical protein